MKNLTKVKKSIRGEVLGKTMRDRIRSKSESSRRNYPTKRSKAKRRVTPSIKSGKL